MPDTIITEREADVARVEWALKRGIRQFTCGEDCDLTRLSCRRCWEQGSRGAGGCACHSFSYDLQREIRATAERIVGVTS